MKTLPQQSWRGALSIAKVLCAISICFSSTQVLGETVSLTPLQADNIASVEQFTDNPTVASIARGVMFVESKAGLTNKSNGNCHGMMQIHSGTAVSILKDHPQVGDKYGVTWKQYAKVTQTLVKFPMFGVELAVAHISDIMNKGLSVDRTILAYNMGEDGARRSKRVNTPYVQKVKAMMLKLTPKPRVAAEQEI